MFQIPAKSGIDIPDGSYTAMLESVERGVNALGEYLRWHWLVEVPDERGVPQILPATGLTSANLGSQAKAHKILAALMGRELSAGESFEAPTGTRVLVTITHKGDFANVTEVLPFVEPVKSEGIPR